MGFYNKNNNNNNMTGVKQTAFHSAAEAAAGG